MTDTYNQITMATNNLGQQYHRGSQDTSAATTTISTTTTGNHHHRLTAQQLRKANSLSKLPMPQHHTGSSPSSLHISPASSSSSISANTSLSPTSPTRSPPVLKSSLLQQSQTLIPPPRSKRNSQLRLSPTKSSGSSRSHDDSSNPSPTSPLSPTRRPTSPGFTYSKKAPAPAPPPKSSTTRSLLSSIKRPSSLETISVDSHDKNGNGDIDVHDQQQSLRQETLPLSSLQMSSASAGTTRMTLSSTSSTSSSTSSSPTAPRRPSRDRIRSHSPPKVLSGTNVTSGSTLTSGKTSSLLNSPTGSSLLDRPHGSLILERPPSSARLERPHHPTSSLYDRTTGSSTLFEKSSSILEPRKLQPPVFQPPPAPSRPPPPETSYDKPLTPSRIVKSEARLFVNPEVPGYVGFANLPNQVHRKSVKKGFEFTLMVVGESGLGKSTLVNSLFLTDLYPERQLADAAEKIEKTVKIDASAVEIEERGVKLRLTVVDTPGFADALNNDNCFKTIISYIDDQFERYLHDESGLNRRHIVDNRVHCCFYFVNPAGHGLKPLDISFMKAVHHKVNIVPVIAKADTLTRAEVMRLKKKIMKQVEDNGILLYQLPDCDEDEDEDYKEQCHQLKEAVPFAVVGANQVIEIRGRKVRGRMYPWGVVEVENPEHCDFIKLRTMLITHMQDLQEVTQEIHYENFRSEKLAVSDGQMRKPKTPRASRIDTDKEAKLSEKEFALQEKENELKRMQEMLARMQAEMKQQQQQQQQQQHSRPKVEPPVPPTHNANGQVNGHPGQPINNNTKPINAQTA